MTEYLNQEQLELRRGLIKVDPILAQLLSPGQYNSSNEANKDVILKSIPNNVKECYILSNVDEDELMKQRSKVHKGQVPHVMIKA